ncbi:unnamed protein product [Withania somnifera]
MLTLSAPLSYKNERENYDLFQDLINTIDFDDFFTGINDGDLLPDLEIVAEFPLSSSEESDISKNNTTTANVKAKSKEKDKAKRKKVDWTPELHKRFLKAVEKLGADKAVPSRILELMATDGLTRHNIASHLQKYRAHQKHLLAREVEAASRSQRKQMYDRTTTTKSGVKRVMMNPWLAPPAMGFPPMAHHIRPLHVWGHPPTNNSFWHPHYQRVLNSVAPGTLYFHAPMAPTRFAAQLMVPGIPLLHAIIKVDSMEGIDAAIEDVLSKPQMPLPIGLKPPAIDSVLNELQCQGVTKIPPT